VFCECPTHTRTILPVFVVGVGRLERQESDVILGYNNLRRNLVPHPRGCRIAEDQARSVLVEEDLEVRLPLRPRSVLLAELQSSEIIRHGSAESRLSLPSEAGLTLPH